MAAVCKAMRDVMEAGFVLTDLTLYLDTHPDCRHGLDCFSRAKERYQTAVKLYNSQHGPLIATDSEVYGSWSWIASPWPWEGEV